MAVSGRLRLWDTCSYVRRFSDRRVDVQIEEEIHGQRFVLCSVVAMELYAGTRDLRTKRALDRLVRCSRENDLVVTPVLGDYQEVGVALGRYGRRRGRVNPHAHFRDALIVACAKRCDAVIVTENTVDFARWTRWLAATRVHAAPPD